MLYLVMLFYGTLFCWWKGKFSLVESVFEDTKTRSGFVTRETDATQIFIGRHGKTDRFTTANETQSDLAV